MLLPTMAAVMILLTLSAGFGFLRPAIYTIHATGLGLLLWEVAIAGKRTFRSISRPGMVWLLGLLVCLWLLGSEARFLTWDEFSHWGLVSKFIAHTGRLPMALGDVIFRDYPVTPALFHSFMNPAGPFSESAAIWAQCAMIGIGILPLFAKTTWRSPGTLMVAVLVGVLSGFWFSEIGLWNNVLVDGLMTTISAGAFIAYLGGGRNVGSILVAAPAVVLLPLLKDFGILFSACVIGLVVVDQAILSWKEKRIPSRAVVFSCGMAFAAFVARQAWIFHLEIIGVEQNFTLSLKTLKTRLQMNDFGVHFGLVLDAFRSATLWMPLGPNGLATPAWVITCLGLTIAAAIATHQDDNRPIGAISASVAAWLILMTFYFGTLLFLYVFVFSVYEGQGVASFARYVGSFFHFWALCAVGGILLRPIASGRLMRFAALASISAATIWSFAVTRWTLPAGTSLLAHPYQAVSVDRDIVRQRIGELDRSLPEQARVYSLWNGTTGLRHFMTVYELSPRPVNFWYYSLGPKRTDNDIWTENWSPKQFAEEFTTGDYRYLFLGEAGETFSDTYVELFADEIKSGSWYSMDETPGRFRKIDTSSLGGRNQLD